MRYLPLSDADRSEMLRVVGAASIDDLFSDVPEELRLKGPIEGLPLHASEMAVERQRSLVCPRAPDCDRWTGLVIRPLAMGNDDIEAVDGAAQKNDDESLGAALDRSGTNGSPGDRQCRAG